MAVSLLLGGVRHPGGVEIEGRPLAEFGFQVVVAMDRSGSHNLTREHLDRFLARLDPDRGRAGEQYQKLHRKLVKLFEWRGAPCAESLADETIDRVIHKLDQLEIRDLGLYALSVAQNILKESQRIATKNVCLDEAPVSALLANSNEREQQRSENIGLLKRLEYLGKCMRALPAAERKLVVQYYEKKFCERYQHWRRLCLIRTKRGPVFAATRF